MQSIRDSIRSYGRCCERLLSSGILDTPLTDEETQFIRYYVAEMEKKFDGVLYPPKTEQSLQE